ncbi:FAD-binding oxidoreductase [Candidatus Solincola sp.]|nr:FAD-binding oxidoreductase [Actinomycetota bacterium]MDI7252279.1 FAD-binding oxidoreductase [Actinomycetota bacterium]
MISEEAYRELEEIVGPENVSREPAVLEGYAWQPFLNDDPELWIKRPVAAVLPGSTEEVREVVRACNRHGLKFKALSTGWGAIGGPSTEGVVQVDLRRMDRILEIDEKNMYAVVEPYVCGAQLQAEAMKRGLNTHIIGAGPSCSPLASATSMSGVGHDCIFMSYSARNVLGVEWVLPDGEILRLGTPGSGLGWFSGDGPGPSLRGIMRGALGALSGLGIFTKCAVKLYNWPGPQRIEAEGLVLDSQVEVPPNLRFYLLVFPGPKEFADALYEIGESEIGYAAVRIAAVAYVALMMPHSGFKLLETRALRPLLTKTLKYPLTFVLAGDSPEETDFQEAVLKEIVDRNRGILVDFRRLGPMERFMPLNFLRVSIIPLAFRPGGIFGTCLDGNEVLDTQMKWVDVISEAKKEFIEKGAIMDDEGDNPYFVPYENNTWAHCEITYAYRVDNPVSLENLNPIEFTSTLNAIEQCMTPLSVFIPPVRKVMSPLAGHFNRWQRRISEALDPNGAADVGFYTEEKDFAWQRIDEAKKERLRRLQEKLTWTEDGPPA